MCGRERERETENKGLFTLPNVTFLKDKWRKMNRQPHKYESMLKRSHLARVNASF